MGKSVIPFLSYLIWLPLLTAALFLLLLLAYLFVVTVSGSPPVAKAASVLAVLLWPAWTLALAWWLGSGLDVPPNARIAAGLSLGAVTTFVLLQFLTLVNTCYAQTSFPLGNGHC